MAVGPTQSEELDSKRGIGLEWLMYLDNGRHASARLNPNQPIAVSMLRGIMNRVYQLTNTKFYDPQKGLTINGKVIIGPKPSENFSPRVHYWIDDSLISPMGNEILNNFLDSTKAVEAQRAKLVSETISEIGKPNTNIFGQIQDLMKGSRGELEIEDE